MNLGDNYTWEAEFPENKIVDKTVLDSPVVQSGSLKNVVRFSLIPTKQSKLPRHDFIGIKMVRRFGRGFQSIKFNQKKTLPGLFYWENGSQQLNTSENLVSQLHPGTWIGKGVDGEKWYKITKVKEKYLKLQLPYVGNSKPKGMQAKILIFGKPKNNYYSCVIFKYHRAYISHLTGTVLLTPVDYELYI